MVRLGDGDMVEKIKSFYEGHKKVIDYCCCIFLCICVVTCGVLLFRHYRNAGTATGHDAAVTIQQIEGDNQSARHDIDSASSQIESAQAKLDNSISDLDRASDSVGQLQSSVDSDKDTISECNSLIESGRGNVEEARGIFEAVDSANKTDGASR